MPPPAQEPRSSRRDVAQVPALGRAAVLGLLPAALLRENVPKAPECDPTPIRHQLVRAPDARSAAASRSPPLDGAHEPEPLLRRPNSLVRRRSDRVDAACFLSCPHSRYRYVCATATGAATGSSVNPHMCELASIIRCPERVQHLPHFDLLPRFAQCLATYALALAMTSVDVAHRMLALDARRHRAKFVTFQRRMAALPASAAV